MEGLWSKNHRKVAEVNLGDAHNILADKNIEEPESSGQFDEVLEAFASSNISYVFSMAYH